jgi:hypothetical protein
VDVKAKRLDDESSRLCFAITKPEVAMFLQQQISGGGVYPCPPIGHPTRLRGIIGCNLLYLRLLYYIFSG